MNPSLVLADEGATPAAGTASPRPALTPCLLLAALLHLWLVALVGTAPGDSAQPGAGPLGAIQIRLAGPGPANSTGRADMTLPSGGLLGRAPEPRFGGTVRDARPLPSPEPGAAELGLWRARPSPGPLSRSSAPVQTQVDPAPVAAPTPVMNRREPQAPQRREDVAAPVLAPATAPEPPPRPAPDAKPAGSTAPKLAPVDTVEAPVLDRPAQAQHDIAYPAPVPTAAPRPQAAPAPLRDERATALPLPEAVAPPPRPAPLPQALVRASPLPLAVAPPLTPPVPTATPLVPTPVPLPVAVGVAAPPSTPAVPLSAIEPPPPAQTAPAAEPPLPAAEAARSVVPRSPTLSPVDAGEMQRLPAPDLVAPPMHAVENVPAPPAVAPAPAAVREPVTPPLPAGLGMGLPDVGARQGIDRASPPSAAASTPRLNLELPRGRAPLPGLAASRLLNLVPPPPERKSALAEGIERAAKPDCRKAYSGLGPLAVLPLAVDALRDGGCRW